MNRILRLFSYFLLLVFVNGCLKKPNEPPDSDELPVITSLRTNIVFPKPDDVVIVLATVTAPDGAPINSVRLKWAVNAVSVPEIEMNRTGNEHEYSGTITGQFADNDAVAYTVIAKNKNGKEEKTGNYTVKITPPNLTNDYFHLTLNEINGNGDDSDRYIEIYNNSSDDAVRLEGVKIYYNNFNSEPAITWEGGKDVFIHPKGFKLLQGTKATGDLSTGLSPTQGIVVELVDPAGNSLDFFKIDEKEYRSNSYSRIPDGKGKWYLTSFAGTPSVTNGTAFVELIPTRPFITGLTRDKLVPAPNDQVNISATVRAFSGTALSSVVVKWKLDGVAQPDRTTTNNKDAYMATIPENSATSKVEYTLVATNDEGEKAEASSIYFVYNAGDFEYNNLVINEIDGNSKFVELYNKGNVPIPLAGVYLVKNEQAFHWWDGSDAAYIEAKKYYAIAQTKNSNPNPPSNANEYTGVNGISARQNLKFELWSPGNSLLDNFTRTNNGKLGDRILPDYSESKYSFSRCPDGSGGFGMANPSCNAANPATAISSMEAF